MFSSYLPQSLNAGHTHSQEGTRRERERDKKKNGREIRNKDDKFKKIMGGRERRSDRERGTKQTAGKEKGKGHEEDVGKHLLL